MSTTSLLSLPYIAAGQAQKHVTVNEALRMLDALVQLSVKTTAATTPPTSPTEGERHQLGSSPTGAWAGHANKIAAFQDGTWVFFTPRTGWVIWHEITGLSQFWNGTAWTSPANTYPTLGVNASADTYNRLIVSAPGVLFTHEGADQRLTINKNATANVAAQMFQTNYSGRAEIGLLGNDAFQIKVSPNGSTFHIAVSAESDGSVRLPRNPLQSFAMTGGQSGVLTSDVWVPITSAETTWSEALASPASMFNASTGSYTASVAGHYRCAGSATFYQGSSMGTNYLSLWKNNSQINGTMVGMTASVTNGYTAIQTEAILFLNAGDTINLRAYVSAGGVRLQNGGSGFFNAQFLG
ncbi:MAG: DUF2793 domain-containing protein [Rhabdaerophilum sp.]